jgi:hypothetical protein
VVLCFTDVLLWTGFVLYQNLTEKERPLSIPSTTFDHISNNSDITYSFVELGLVGYNSQKDIVHTDSTYAFSPIPPHSEIPFDFLASKEEAKDIPTIKESASAQSKQERIKFPCYADRIIAKFNQPRNINDFYHTYSPIADAFIMKYGTVEQRTNQTFDCGMDTKYSIKGKVDCGDGEVIYGTFGVTLGAVDNICYHREFISSTEKEYEDINGTSDLESESAELVSKDDAYVSARLQFNANNDEIYGEKRFNENSNFIVIEDKRNEVTITLFKTENNNFVH